MRKQKFYVTYVYKSGKPNSSISLTALDYWEACQIGHANMPRGVDDFIVTDPKDPETGDIPVKYRHLHPGRNKWLPTQTKDEQGPRSALFAQPPFPMTFGCYWVSGRNGSIGLQVTDTYRSYLGETLSGLICRALEDIPLNDGDYLLGSDPLTGREVVKINLKEIDLWFRTSR